MEVTGYKSFFLVEGGGEGIEYTLGRGMHLWGEIKCGTFHSFWG